MGLNKQPDPRGKKGFPTYQPPVSVDPGENDPGGANDVGYPVSIGDIASSKPANASDLIRLVNLLYPTGVGRKFMGMGGGMAQQTAGSPPSGQLVTPVASGFNGNLFTPRGLALPLHLVQAIARNGGLNLPTPRGIPGGGTLVTPGASPGGGIR